MGVIPNMDNTSDFTVDTEILEEKRKLYDVEIYNSDTLLGIVTVTAKDPEDASNVAVQGINVKIKRNYN